MSESVSADVVRELEEDHDLLTYNEAGARLAEEIQRLEREAAELESAGDPSQAAEFRARATALGAAAERNGQRAKTDTNAKGFLDYRPQASR